MTQRPNDHIATIEGISKYYGNLKALDQLDLTLKRGEVLSILGPNGAGKTTLINALLGRVKLAQGKIRVFGYTPGDIRLKRLCGAMLQVADLPDTLKIREYIQLFQSYYARPMAYEQVVEYAGLKAIEEQFAKSLSGGQKQRLLFALAICGNPKLLFLDEPSVGMDITARKSLWQAIKHLKSQGTSIILTTHYLEEADFLSDRVVMINQGRVIQQGTPAEIKSQVHCQKIRFKSDLPLSQLAALPHVTQVQRTDPYIELQSSAPSETLKQLFTLTDTLDELTVTGAALEDAFLQLNKHDVPRQDAA